jgi:hypothetical protein
MFIGRYTRHAYRLPIFSISAPVECRQSVSACLFYIAVPATHLKEKARSFSAARHKIADGSYGSYGSYGITREQQVSYPCHIGLTASISYSLCKFLSEFQYVANVKLVFGTAAVLVLSTVEHNYLVVDVC